METTAAAAVSAAAAANPSADEPATRIHQTKPQAFTNGFLKLKPKHLIEPFGVGYKECLRNHAAAMGGHVLDGCGEFMPSSDGDSLLCSACNCHRNFHRRENFVIKEVQEELKSHHRYHHPFPPAPPSPLPISSAPPDQKSMIKEAAHMEFLPHHLPPPPSHSNSLSPPSPPPISSNYYPLAPNMLLALNNNPNPNPNPNSASRKRFRTKFSQDQKTKMYELAEKIGWKMQRRDDHVIDSFCNGIGVEKGVFKVWMHNNKNIIGKKETSNEINIGVIGINLDNPPIEENYNFNDLNNNVSANPVGTKGSSSSP